MGSQTKRLRKMQARTLRMVVTPLIAKCLRKPKVVCECYDLGKGEVIEMTVDGWTLCASLIYHASEEDPDEELQHWHLSLRLHPYKRAEREDDWLDLGRFMERFTRGTGYEGPAIEPVRPLDRDPHEAHHFTWHADSSAVRPEYLRILSRAIVMARHMVQQPRGTA